MTPHEAARTLGISYSSVLYHIKFTQSLPALKTPKGTWWIDPEAVKTWKRPPIPKPGERGGRRPGAGRPPSGKPNEPDDRRIFMGTDLTPEEVRLVRQYIKPGMRGAILFAIARLYEQNKTDKLKRMFEILWG